MDLGLPDEVWVELGGEGVYGHNLAKQENLHLTPNHIAFYAGILETVFPREIEQFSYIQLSNPN